MMAEVSDSAFLFIGSVLLPEGFIKLFGLPITVQALMDERRAAAVEEEKSAKGEQ